MKHLTAMAIKFISSLVLLYVILGLFYGMSFGSVFLITLVLGVASYILGDMMILPRTNNFTATIADFGLAFAIIWILTQGMTYIDNTFGASLIAALGVGLFEYFFHRYIQNRVIDENERNTQQRENLQYQTEAGEEFAPVRPDVRTPEEEE